MIREIRTAEQLIALISSGVGFLYNDFGGRDPRMCPIHSMRCRWVPTMLRQPSGSLGVPKLWSDDLNALVAEVHRRGKVYAFCGSEPDLASGARRTPSGASVGALSARPAASQFPVRLAERAGIGSSGFRVRFESGVVTVESSYRLQFDSKPATKALKGEIGAAVAQLAAAPNQMLEAVYTSASLDFVDAENVLLYNVGTGRFAASAHAGLRFERVFADPQGEPHVSHHHLYQTVSIDSPSRHWRSGPLVVEMLGIRIGRLDALSKPDSVWLAIREAAPLDARPHAGRYSLELALEVGPTDGVRPADIVKPLIDGAVAGLHAHDGRDADVVASTLAGRLGLPLDRVSALLADERRAWLGTRRLLYPRADGIQWNPGDDACVSASLQVHRRSGTDWRLGLRLHAVEAIG